MHVGINIRVFHKVDSSYLVGLTYYEKEFSNIWKGPLLPIGTKVNVMSCEGTVASCTTNLSVVEMAVEIGVKDQEELDSLSKYLLGLEYISFDVPYDGQ
jgi:hypothetical protein